MNLEYMFNSGFTSLEQLSKQTNEKSIKISGGQRGRNVEQHMLSPGKLTLKLEQTMKARTGLFSPQNDINAYPSQSISNISSSKETLFIREQIKA